MQKTSYDEFDTGGGAQLSGDSAIDHGSALADGWSHSARLIPAPHTAAEKAALAASLHASPSKRPFNKTRLAIGAAALAFCIAVPSLSLEAMVGTVRSSYFGPPKTATVQEKPIKHELATQIWSPAQQVAGPVYTKALAIAENAASPGKRPQIGNFDRELPVSILEAGSETFDLAFAGIEAPSPLNVFVSAGIPEGPAPIAPVRSSAIATDTIAIEQIGHLDLVVRATPENAQADQSSLAVGSSSARTNAIANRSVEAAFAGAIDVSNAVRSSLPIAPTPWPNPSAPNVDEVRQAIPLARPSSDLRGAAAAQAVLVPKSKLDARVNGVLTGSVEFRQLDGTIAIRLRSIANMMRERFDQTEFAEIIAGQSIDTFVSLAELQAAGIPVSYNPAYDEVEFGIDYQDAPNAKKVHVDQISVPPLDRDLTAIEQIPR